MKRISLLLLLFAGLQTLAFAQDKFFTKTAKISFDADGALDDLEEIKAESPAGICVYDATSGKMEWQVSIRTFKFENSLMQEHFNENYMESEKFPKATFKGQIADFKTINLTKNGTYPATVSGTLSIHGQSKEIKAEGKFVKNAENISVSADFSVLLQDYGIERPSVVGMKIAEKITISISADLKHLKK